MSPVDQDQDLFAVTNVAPTGLVDEILSTPWLDLPWSRQGGQESWLRRRIDTDALSWYGLWNECISSQWHLIENNARRSLQYQGTAWWLDEPGFCCQIHTDGEMPGALHLMWIGDAGLGTTFYHYRDLAHVRYQFPFLANCGYLMINQADTTGYRKLQWHAMMQPVPQHCFRLTSYTWLVPRST